MQIQAVNRQQLELKELMIENQRLHNKKSQQLLAKLEAVKNEQCDVDFLQNIHLPYTLAFLKEIVVGKKQEVGSSVSQEESIEKQVLAEYSVENKLLVEQILQIQAEIEQIKSRNQQLLLAQRHTSSRISELEERLMKNTLNLRKQNSLYFKKHMSPCLSFGYEKQTNDIFEFQTSYQNIVNHFVKRICENQEIIGKLQNLVKDRVKQSQMIKAKIANCKQLNGYSEKTTENLEELKKKCQSAREQLRNRMEAANQEINRRLPEEIDRKIKDIHGTKECYEKAYHALVQITNQVVDNADLSRVTDYINQS